MGVSLKKNQFCEIGQNFTKIDIFNFVLFNKVMYLQE